jgi:hypothetical protein
MTIQPGAVVYTQGFGSAPQDVQTPIISTVDPGIGDVLYPLGKRWINMVANNVWTLTSLIPFNGGITAHWQSSGGATTSISEITAGTGTAIPIDSIVQILGTAGEITTSATGNAVTLSIPATATLTNLNASTLNVTGNSTIGTTAGADVEIATGITSTLEIGTASSTLNLEGTFNLNNEIGNANATTIGNVSGTNTLTLSSGGILAINSADFIQASAPIIRLSGGLYMNTRNVSANYTMVNSDFYIGVNTTGGVVTVNLVAGALAGQTVIIADISGDVATNEIIINGNGFFINVPGGTSQSQLAITVPYTSHLLINNGTTWSVI